MNSNMLPEFSRDPRELPWQTKLGKNKPKLHRFQFCTRYGDNVCVYCRVFWVGEFKYANKNLKEAKRVAIAIKLRQKSQKCTDFTFVRETVTIFTALDVMQTRYCDENSVRLSVRPFVRPSVTRVYCDKTVQRSVQIYITYERTFSLVF